MSLFFNYKQYRDAQEQPADSVRVERITRIEFREIKVQEPKPSVSKANGKISVKRRKNSENLETNPDSLEINDSMSEIITETDSTLEVPITQHVYEDSLYTAYVSGFHSKLDSIIIRNRIITEYVNTTKNRTKTKRFTFGLQGGYYLTPKGLQPGIGFGCSLNLF